MLTGKQKQYLKSEAVSLPAYVQIGKEGMTSSVVQSVEDVLLARELIKVQINQNSDEDIRDTASLLISPSQWHLLPTRRPMNHQAR